MKTLILVSLVCLAIPWVGGCGPSYRSTPLHQSVSSADRIAVKKFAADNPAAEQMIRATLAVELKEAGLLVIDVNDSPDLIIGGTITEAHRIYTGKYIDAVFVIVSNQNGDLITTLKFHQSDGYVSLWSAKRPAEIGTELGKRFARKFKKK